jgi:hypothetical protein
LASCGAPPGPWPGPPPGQAELGDPRSESPSLEEHIDCPVAPVGFDVSKTRAAPLGV